MNTIKLSESQLYDLLNRPGPLWLRWIEVSSFDFGDANLKDAQLGHARFNQCWFSKTILKGANLGKAKFIDCIAPDADMQGADMRGVGLERTFFENANLHGANLEWAIMKKTNFRSSNLQEANLSLASSLGDCRFTSAVLEGADMMKAKLPGSRFDGANLQKANLQEADLSGCDLKNADLRGANLQGTNLNGANLQGANLEGATGVPIAGPGHRTHRSAPTKSPVIRSKLPGATARTEVDRRSAKSLSKGRTGPRRSRGSSRGESRFGGS
jgi:uncharacterized protein YjbI with pentapeptide repeats